MPKTSSKMGRLNNAGKTSTAPAYAGNVLNLTAQLTVLTNAAGSGFYGNFLIGDPPPAGDAAEVSLYSSDASVLPDEHLFGDFAAHDDSGGMGSSTSDWLPTDLGWQDFAAHIWEQRGFDEFILA
jgi:hypothetical protein